MNASEVQLPALQLGEAAAEGLHLLGVMAVEGKPPALSARDQLLIVHRDLGALTRIGAFEIPEMSRAEVMLHQQALDQAMQHWTVVPVPFGIVFRERESVLRFLEEQYQPLREALTLVEGRWEFRLHIRDEEGHSDVQLARDAATHIYDELRRITHAAIPLPREGRTVLSAAFLLDREATSRFLERVEELGDLDSALALDVTGPWPPYDFVRISVGSEKEEVRSEK